MVAGGCGWFTLFLLTLTDGEGGTVVEECPVFVLLERPLMTVIIMKEMVQECSPVSVTSVR